MNAFRYGLIFGVLLSPLTVTTRAQAPAAAGGSQSFAFKFQKSEPLVYSVTFKTRTTTDMNIAGKSSLQSKTSVISYDVRMTWYRDNKNGTTTIYFKPFNVIQDLDVNGPGHLVSHVENLKIKSYQNNILTVDTENNIGMGQAGQIKVSIYPTLLSGFFDFTPNGGTSKFGGDLPFIDYWTQVFTSQIGFFNILLPDHPIASRDTWTEVLAQKSTGGANLDEPLVITNTFTRDPDLVTNGVSMAAFEVSSSQHQQNISGYFEQNGQRSTLNIPQFNENGYGSFLFDPKRGVLLDAQTTDQGDFTMEMLSQGNPATSHMTIETDRQISLIPDPAATAQQP